MDSHRDMDTHQRVCFGCARVFLVLGSEESRQGRKNRRLGVYQEDSKPGAERESPIKIPTPESGAFVPAV